MSKPLVKLIELKKRAQLEKHMGAKDKVDETEDVQSFVQAWEQHWIDSADTSRLVEDDGFHPSTIGIYTGKCGRRNVYLLRGIAKEPNFPSRILRVFGNGHGVHDRLQKSLESMDVGMESEIEISADLPMPVRGHADGVLEWNDRKVVVEIKSCSDDVFNNRIKFKKPKDEHFDQANLYAHVLGLDWIWIIYENKNTQELKVFEKPADRAKSQKQLDAWHAQWLVFQDNKLPVRPYKPDSSTCAGCDLKTHCFADPEMGVELKEYKAKVKAYNKEQEDAD